MRSTLQQASEHLARATRAVESAQAELDDLLDPTPNVLDEVWAAAQHLELDTIILARCGRGAIVATAAGGRGTVAITGNPATGADTAVHSLLAALRDAAEVAA